MPTAVGDEVVECVGTTTLLLSSAAIFVRDWDDLSTVGPSVGEDSRVGSSDGRKPRARSRDWLPVTLRDVQINGKFTEDGLRYDGDTRENALTLKRKMVSFLKDGTDRAFTIRLTEYGTVYEAAARFEEFGRFKWPTRDICDVNVLLTVPGGVLVEVP